MTGVLEGCQQVIHLAADGRWLCKNQTAAMRSNHQWIGLREKMQENLIFLIIYIYLDIYLLEKSMVSCRCDLKPIH